MKASDEIRRQSKLLNSGESELDDGRTAEPEKEKTKGIGVLILDQRLGSLILD